MLLRFAIATLGLFLLAGCGHAVQRSGYPQAASISKDEAAKIIDSWLRVHISVKEVRTVDTQRATFVALQYSHQDADYRYYQPVDQSIDFAKVASLKVPGGGINMNQVDLYDSADHYIWGFWKYKWESPTSQDQLISALLALCPNVK